MIIYAIPMYLDTVSYVASRQKLLYTSNIVAVVNYENFFRDVYTEFKARWDFLSYAQCI